MQVLKLDRIIRTMGIIELRGVLSSWAIDENNMERIFSEVRSSSLILEISLHIATTWVPPFIKETLTWMKRLGFEDRKTLSSLARLRDSASKLHEA